MARTSFSVFAFACALSVAGCDCSGNLGGGPCDGPTRPMGCGQACGDPGGRPCPGGLYCSAAGTCTADCLAGGTCPGGICTPDGRCSLTDSGMSADAPRPDRYDPFDGTCASVTLMGSRTTPNVILVIDRSGSMDQNFDGTGTRWEVLERSLVDMPDGLIYMLQSSVRFGTAMYTNESSPGGCPDLLTVPCAIDNYTAIESDYRMRGPGGQTPTGESVSAVLSMIDTLAPVRTDPTIIVLATDGEPDTCADGNDEVNGRIMSVNAAMEAYAAGVRLYVISVGTDTATSHLQEVANAGVGMPISSGTAPFWVATDTAGLRDALTSIVGGVLSCTVQLEGMIDVAQACSGTVTLGTDTLACGTDWRAVDSTHIELLGAACTRLQTTMDELSATFPCGVVIF